MNKTKTNKSITVDNKISRDIRNLFPEIKERIKLETLTTKIIVDQYLEKTEEIAQLNLVASGEPLKDLTRILQVDDFNLQGIAWATIGGIHTANGNYKNAFTCFNMALDLNTSNNVRANIYTELSNLLRKLGYTKESISILKATSAFCNNEKLKWRINSLLGLCYKFIDPDLSLELLTESAEYYKENNEHFRHANVLKNIGEYYFNRYDFISATNKYNQAKTIAQKHKLIQIEFEILNDEA